MLDSLENYVKLRQQREEEKRRFRVGFIIFLVFFTLCHSRTLTYLFVWHTYVHSFFMTSCLFSAYTLATFIIEAFIKKLGSSIVLKSIRQYQYLFLCSLWPSFFCRKGRSCRNNLQQSRKLFLGVSQAQWGSFQLRSPWAKARVRTLLAERRPVAVSQHHLDGRGSYHQVRRKKVERGA